MTKLKKLWNENTYKILILFSMIFLSKLVFFMLYYLLSGDFSPANFLTSINRFDSDQYARIILNGYSALPLPVSGEAGWAFFPLFPLFIRFLYITTGLSPALIAFVVNTLFLFGFLYTGCKYIKLTGGDELSQIFFAFLYTFGCYSFYTSLIYSESIALFLLVLCFYELEKKNYILMGVYGLLLTATRNMGIFFEFVILIKWLMNFYDDRKNSNISFFNYLKKSLTNPSLVLGISLIPFGMFSYMYYLYKLTGDGLAFVHVQYGWGRTNSFFIKVFLDGIKLIAGYAPYLALWVVLGVWLMIVLTFKYHSYHEAFYGLICLIIPMQSALDSIPRYMFGAFVFYKVLSVIISESKWYNKIFALCFIAFYEIVLLNGWFMGEGILT